MSHITSCKCSADHMAIIERRVSRDKGGCWQWTGEITREGYGRLQHADRKWTAHRFVYMFVAGEIPDGRVLDHLCRNRACVNPAHLEPVTDRENILRGEGLAAQYSARDTCDKGHALTPSRTRGRRCMVCHRESMRTRGRAA